MAFIQVAVPVPLRQLFTYTYDNALSAGVRVVVPFGPRKLVGVVVETLHKPESDIENSNKLKAIESVLDDSPIIGSTIIMRRVKCYTPCYLSYYAKASQQRQHPKTC